MEENEKAKMDAIKGSARQAKPNPEKTLGDVLRKVMAGAGIKGECQCEVCVAERAEVEPKGMRLGAVTVEGIGDHISATFEREGETFVLSIDGDGAEYVQSDDGRYGVRFKSREAMGEFFGFIEQVQEV